MATAMNVFSTKWSSELVYFYTHIHTYLCVPLFPHMILYIYKIYIHVLLTYFFLGKFHESLLFAFRIGYRRI